MKKREDKRIITIGVVLALVVILVCILLFTHINGLLKKSREEAQAQGQLKLSEEMQKEIKSSDDIRAAEAQVTAAPEMLAASVEEDVTKPVATILPEISIVPEITKEPTPEPTPEPTRPPDIPAEKVTGELMESSAVDLSGYGRVGIAYAGASSELVQEGINNSGAMAFDGDSTTSWQEGVEGAGAGQSVYAGFDGTYRVRYISFKLGNWRDASNWEANSKPSSLSIWIGEEAFSIAIPCSMTEYTLALSHDIIAEDIYVTVTGVYTGEYEDMCISEITVYGR